MARGRTTPDCETAAPGPSRRGALAGGLAAVLGGAGIATGTARAGDTSGDVPTALRAAIAAHRAAWTAFQAAPEAEASRAEDRETRALGALLGARSGTEGGARALAAHLGWYLAEEGDNLAGAGNPLGRIARARYADLALALGGPVPPADPPGPSAILAAIAAHAEANAAASAAALTHSRALDSGDPAAEDLLRQADEACEHENDLLTALRELRPADLGEAAALAEHYASLIEEWEPNSMSEWLVYGLATALDG